MVQKRKVNKDRKMSIFSSWILNLISSFIHLFINIAIFDQHELHLEINFIINGNMAFNIIYFFGFLCQFFDIHFK